MLNNFVVFILAFTVPIVLLSKENAYKKVFDEEAPFCHFYEDLGDSDEVIKLLEKAKREGGIPVYQFANSDVEIYYRDVVRWRYDALDFRVKKSAKDFREKLLLWTSHLSLKARADYYSSMNLSIDPDLQNRYNQCLRDRVSPRMAEMNAKLTQAPANPLLYRDVIDRHFKGAISLAAILEKIDIVEREFTKSKKQASGRRAALKAKTIGLPTIPPDISEELKNLGVEIRSLESLQQQTLLALKVPLYQLAKDYPLLFSFDWQPEVLNWLHKEIVPSEFYHELISGVDDDLWKVLKGRVAVIGDFNALLEIYSAPELQDELNTFFNRKYQNTELKAKATKAAESYVTELTEHSLSICEEREEHKLHYNRALVESVFSQNRRSLEYQNLTVKDQAGYCQLLREDPPIFQDGFSKQEKIGFSAFATGMLTQFLTARTRWSNSLYALGTGAFLKNGFDDWQINSLLRSSTVTMIPNGFSDIGEYKRLLNEKGDIITAAVTEILFSGAVVGALRHVDRTYMKYLVKNYDVEKYEFNYPLKLFAGFNRGKVKQALIADGSEEARAMYMAITEQKNKLFSRMTQKYQKASDLKGLRDLLGRYTLNQDWSAYLSYRRKKSDIDIVMVALQKGAHKTKEGLARFNELKGKLRKFQTTSEAAALAIDRAFNAKLLLPQLTDIRKKIRGKNFYDYDGVFVIDNRAKIEGGTLHVKLELIENGKKVQSTKQFESKTAFLEHLSKVKSYSIKGVSASPANESISMFWSHLMDDMFELSMDHRIYEITRKRLRTIKSKHGISKYQEEVLELLEQALKKTPRIDLTLKTLFAELRWELFDGAMNLAPILKRFFIKDNAKLKRFDESYDQITNSHPILSNVRNVIYLSMAGYSAKVVTNLFDHGSYWHQQKELVASYWRDTLRFILRGRTPSERECAIAVRPLEFLICYHKLAFSEVGYEWSKGLGSGEPFSRDRELKRKSRAFADRMIRLRRRLRAAELYGINNIQANRAISNAMIDDLIDRILKNTPESEEIDREILGSLVFGLFQTNSNEEFLMILGRIRAVYPENIVVALAKAWRSKSDIKKLMADEFTLPIDIVDLIDNVKVSIPGDNSDLAAGSVLGLFESDLISAAQQMQREEQIESEVFQILSGKIEGEELDPSNKLIREILKEVEEEARIKREKQSKSDKREIEALL